MHVGFVCSGGGAVLEGAIQVLADCRFDVNAYVVTDRQCGAETVCSRFHVPFVRIEESNREVFSSKAAHWLFDQNKVDLTVLLFSRLVSAGLYTRGPCVNIHPSLLPAFPGFGALKAALTAGVKYFGATAHLVNEKIDGGPILAQVVASLSESSTLDQMVRISFAQKLYLLLVIIEKQKTKANALHRGAAEGLPASLGLQYANPALQNPDLEGAFLRFVSKEGIPWPN